MPIDGAKIKFARDVTTGTVEREPRTPGADRAIDARDEQRLDATLAACVPQVDEASGGSVRGALDRGARPLPHGGSNVLLRADCAFARTAHERQRRRRLQS